MIDCDLVVVGAGPAGSITAKTAAEKGIDVVMIDKRQEIGVPVRCAEATGRETFEELGIKPDKKFIATEINEVKIVSPNKNEVVFRIKDYVQAKAGYVLERKMFDKHLAIQAAQAGAKIHVKTRAVELQKENGEITGIQAEKLGESFPIKSKIIVGADGVESNVSKWAGLKTTLKPNDADSGIQFEMVGADIDPHLLEFYVGHKIAPGGYLWVFPKGKDIANVGVGISGGHETPALTYLEQFIANDERFRDGSIVEINASSIPVCGPLKKTVVENVMLVGDAARQTDPLSGGGMRNGMFCGKIAGEVAAATVSENDVSEDRLMTYEDRWRAALGKDYRRKLKAKEVFQDLTDEELDMLVESVAETGIEELSTLGLVKALVKKKTTLLWKLKDIL